MRLFGLSSKTTHDSLLPIFRHFDGPFPLKNKNISHAKKSLGQGVSCYLEVFVFVVVRKERRHVVRSATREAGRGVLGRRQVALVRRFGGIRAHHVGHPVHWKSRRSIQPYYWAGQWPPSLPVTPILLVFWTYFNPVTISLWTIKSMRILNWMPSFRENFCKRIKPSVRPLCISGLFLSYIQISWSRRVRLSDRALRPAFHPPQGRASGQSPSAGRPERRRARPGCRPHPRGEPWKCWMSVNRNKGSSWWNALLVCISPRTRLPCRWTKCRPGSALLAACTLWPRHRRRLKRKGTLHCTCWNNLKSVREINDEARLLRNFQLANCPQTKSFQWSYVPGLEVAEPPRSFLSALIL